MKSFFFVFILSIIANNVYASVKQNIINNFESIKTISFNFTQTVKGKDEHGNCIISYPKKIFCKYKLKFNKVLVSNGKSLVIKSDKNNQYYRYSLNSTPLFYLLDQDFIVSKMKSIKEKLINNKYYLFSIEEKGQILNIFFDKKNLQLIGWQTEDIYQNLSVTYIFDVKTNVSIDNKIFILPKLIN